MLKTKTLDKPQITESLEGLDYDNRIDENESEALSKTLEVFQATVEKKDDEDYELDSLRVIFTM